MKNTTKIIYVYHDSSVPPQYHRSYRISCIENELELIVNTYNEIINQKKISIDKKVFDTIVELLKKLKFKKKTKESKWCCWWTWKTIQIIYDNNESEWWYNYYCWWKIYWNIIWNIDSISSIMKEQFWNFQELLKL